MNPGQPLVYPVGPGRIPEDRHPAATIAFETARRIRSQVLTLECSRVDLAEGGIRLDR